MSRRHAKREISELTAWLGIITIGGALGIVVALLALKREYTMAFAFFIVTITVIFFLALYLLEHTEH
ncbi:MAG: hypothetical protein ACE5R6_16880 [Candidatus Heimdallarchaeota archaeon]